LSKPLLTVQVSLQPPLAQVGRSDDVPHNFWLNVLAEWAGDGPDPRHAVSVPLERFLSRLDWLPDACRRYGVNISWDDGARELILKLRKEREELGRYRAEDPELSESELDARLENTRFTRPLRDFQRRDLRRTLALAHGGNFSVPGAGKTSVMYATYEAERNAGRVERMLVVAPISAFDSWINEAPRCFDSPPVLGVFGEPGWANAEVVLVNYQRLWARYDEVAAWAAQRPNEIVLDEAHRMKRGRAGEWGRVCLDLAFLGERRDVLTGTPAPQHPRDLVPLFDFLYPTQGGNLIPPAARTDPPPPNAGHLIARAIAPLYVRTTKNELGLPRPDYKPLLVPMSPIQADIYRALQSQYVGQFDLNRTDRATLARMGRVVMYMLEASTNPALLTAGSDDDLDRIEFRHPPIEAPAGSRLRELIEEYARYETPKKFEQLAVLVKKSAEAGGKVLVWSNFVRNLGVLQRMLALFQPAVIHGGIPSEVSMPLASLTREMELERFRNDPNCLVLLANPAAMSEGVSLHEVCHHAIYLDRTFNAGQYLQSVDRIHRLGLAPGVTTTITFLITEETVDEVVDDRVYRKAARLAEMLDDPEMLTLALPDDDDYGPAIDSVDDVAALFAHLRGEGRKAAGVGA
jgi:hypothetical protein